MTIPSQKKQVELLNCPFCGGEVVIVKHHLLNHPYVSHKKLFSLQNPSRTCFLESLTLVGKNPEEEWNTRKHPKEV